MYVRGMWCAHLHGHWGCVSERECLTLYWKNKSSRGLGKREGGEGEGEREREREREERESTVTCTTYTWDIHVPFTTCVSLSKYEFLVVK